MRLAGVAAGVVFFAVALACGGSSNIGSVSSGGGSCPSGASYASDLPDGQAVRILALHPEDAYFPDTSTPILGRVDGEMHNNGDCWFGGSFRGADGTDYYFYKAALELASDSDVPAAPAAIACPDGAITDGTIPEGTQLEFLAVHNDDAYFGSDLVRAGAAGRSTGSMNNNGDCWFGGPFVTDSGDDYYFYKAAFRRR